MNDQFNMTGALCKADTDGLALRLINMAISAVSDPSHCRDKMVATTVLLSSRYQTLKESSEWPGHSVFSSAEAGALDVFTQRLVVLLETQSSLEKVTAQDLEEYLRDFVPRIRDNAALYYYRHLFDDLLKKTTIIGAQLDHSPETRLAEQPSEDKSEARSAKILPFILPGRDV